MRFGTTLLVVVLGLMSASCTRREEPAPERDTAHEPAARKAGHAAYDLAQETKEAARKAARELEKAGHEAHEGWKDAKHEAKEKKNQDQNPR